jgi:hypothetical protein
MARHGTHETIALGVYLVLGTRVRKTSGSERWGRVQQYRHALKKKNITYLEVPGTTIY